MERHYTVSKSKNCGLYYAHKKGFEYVPVAGSFSLTRKEAMEYAKMMDNLPNKVEKIEAKRKEQYNASL